MKPINFKEANIMLVRVNSEGESQNLFAHEEKNYYNTFTYLYNLSLLDRLKLLFIGKIWISQMTFGKPLQPIKPEIQVKVPIEK